MVDERLAELCKICNIYLDGELAEIEEAVDEWGIDLVLSSMKRLSIMKKDPKKHPIEQWREIFSEKVRERRQEEITKSHDDSGSRLTVRELIEKKHEDGELSDEAYAHMMDTLDELVMEHEMVKKPSSITEEIQQAVRKMRGR